MSDLPGSFVSPPLAGGTPMDNPMLRTDQIRPVYMIPVACKPNFMGGAGTPRWTRVGLADGRPGNSAGYVSNINEATVPIPGQWVEWVLPLGPKMGAGWGILVNYLRGPNIGYFHVDLNGTRIATNIDPYFAGYGWTYTFWDNTTVPAVPEPRWNDVNILRFTTGAQGNSLGNTAYPNAYYAAYLGSISVYSFAD